MTRPESVQPQPFHTERGLPGLGSLLPISRDALSFFTRSLGQHGGRVKLKVLGRQVLLLGNPDEIEQVLVRDRDAYGRSQEIRSLKPIFGEGLLSSEGELWHRQRALMQPSFQHEALRKYSAIMISNAVRMTGKWRAGDVLDVHKEMMRFTCDVICDALFGDTLPNKRELGEAVETVFGDLRSEVLYLQLWRRLPLERSQKWNRAVRILNRSVRQAIEQRRALPAAHSDLLAVLLEAHDAQGGMSDQQIHDEVLTFFLAGHETAALGLTWACALLSVHPEAQDQIAEEVAVATGGGTLMPEHLSKLPWTSAVIKEALRLYPPLWSMGRKVTRDTTLSGNHVRLGTDVWICVYHLHRDPRWFVDPDEFRPERWLTQPAPKPFTYLPFGIGPRVCIGQHFATAEAVAALASLLPSFRLLATAEQISSPSAWITLRPKQPVMLKLVARP